MCMFCTLHSLESLYIWYIFTWYSLILDFTKKNRFNKHLLTYCVFKKKLQLPFLYCFKLLHVDYFRGYKPVFCSVWPQAWILYCQAILWIITPFFNYFYFFSLTFISTDYFSLTIGFTASVVYFHHNILSLLTVVSLLKYVTKCSSARFQRLLQICKVNIKWCTFKVHYDTINWIQYCPYKGHFKTWTITVFYSEIYSISELCKKCF